jgi:energy-converting hydrogenase Eha subunit B
MFASKTVAAHLMRGGLAAALIAWALLHTSSDPGFAAAAGVLAVVVMRGCPLCWALGLFETIGERMRVR